MTTIRFPDAKRGSTYSHDLEITATSGSIASCVLRMMVKRDEANADSAALVSIDNALLGGLQIISATTPIVIRITITDTQMATLPKGKLFAGIQIELPDGTTEEVENLSSIFQVSPDAVRAVGAP